MAPPFTHKMREMFKKYHRGNQKRKSIKDIQYYGKKRKEQKYKQ